MAYMIMVAPFVLTFTFLRTLDYEEKKVYFVVFTMSVIGFFGHFIQEILLYKMTMIPWVIAFVYFPIMTFIEFTQQWFKKRDEKELHVTMEKRIKRKAEKRYKREVFIEVVENDIKNKRATIKILVPEDEPNFIMAEWKVKRKWSGIKIEKEEWIGEKIKNT